MEGKLKNAKQELYRDLYLFCTFRGLSFVDMRNLKEENIHTYFNEHEWININRQKTNVVSNIRLLDIAKSIIDYAWTARFFPFPTITRVLPESVPLPSISHIIKAAIPLLRNSVAIVLGDVCFFFVYFGRDPISSFKVSTEMGITAEAYLKGDFGS